jgi:hypothetical protein
VLAESTMLRKLLLALALLATATCTPHVATVLAAPHQACCGAITPEGYRLIDLIDSMNVEKFWLAHEHVNWETGQSDRPADYNGPGNHTHCSAFAAALGKRLNIYLLRPPDHSEILLASAQAEWFHSSDGGKKGWTTIEGPQRAHEAQALANRGFLVTIVYESPDPHKPGHIVIVRPSEKSPEDLASEGPQIAQAGTLNHSNSIAAKSFTAHPGAWPDNVKYYSHPVDWASIPPKPAAGN